MRKSEMPNFNPWNILLRSLFPNLIQQTLIKHIWCEYIWNETMLAYRTRCSWCEQWCESFPPQTIKDIVLANIIKLVSHHNNSYPFSCLGHTPLDLGRWRRWGRSVWTHRHTLHSQGYTHLTEGNAHLPRQCLKCLRKRCQHRLFNTFYVQFISNCLCWV